ncbi:MAG: type II toxin-antitoxin system VapC family toxin [Verrucomicrobiota bacterium]
MPEYWDTSCLVKLYCLEEDSDAYAERLSSLEEPLVTSTLTRTELLFAFEQKALRQETNGQSAEQLYHTLESDHQAGRLRFLPLGEDVLSEARAIASDCYAAKPSIPLRTLDGLHLATARLAACSRVVSADERMNAAAKALGIALG